MLSVFKSTLIMFLHLLKGNTENNLEKEGEIMSKSEHKTDQTPKIKDAIPSEHDHSKTDKSHIKEHAPKEVKQQQYHRRILD